MVMSFVLLMIRLQLRGSLNSSHWKNSVVRFFTLHSKLKPKGGPVWLRLRGREGVKAFIREEISGCSGMQLIGDDVIIRTAVLFVLAGFMEIGDGYPKVMAI